MTRPSRGWAWLVAALTVLAVLVTARWVRPTGELIALLPDEGDARAFLAAERLFGAREPGLLLLEGDDPEEVRRAAATAKVAAPTAVTGLDGDVSAPPTSWMLLADGRGTEALAHVLSPDGMRERLRDTRAMLLAPGGGAMAASLRRDPLRIAELVAASRGGGRALASADGTARLVAIPSTARVFDAEAAATARRDLTAAADAVRAAHPSVTTRVAGPHVVAAETEARIRRDVATSSALSLALSALVFLLVSRNPRLLASVVPPVLAGTAMAAALAPLTGGAVSGVAAAFVSVVVGVGMDTGVHAHLAVVDATRAGSPEPVARALAVVSRPALTAAVAAGLAFACLCASTVPALRQLGALAAAGEVLTALAVLAWTPWIAAWIERGRADEPPRARAPSPGVARAALAALTVVIAVGAARGGGPRTDGPVLALRTSTLEVSRTYARLAERLGFPTVPPEVIVLRATSEHELADRVERLADTLARAGLHAEAPLAPAVLARRHAALSRLSLPARADALGDALRDTGFDPAKFHDALADLRSPSTAPPPLPRAGPPELVEDAGAWVAAVRVDAPTPALRQLVLSVEPSAGFGGVAAIERTLKDALRRELSRLLPLSGLVVLASLAVALRRARVVAIAIAAAGVAGVLTWVTLGALGVPLHVFDALVLPVLFGLTLDETLFLHDARARGEIARELPRVATTSLTTAAGFGALLVCEFPGLRDVGWTGLIGSVAGLVGSVLVVCAVEPEPAPPR